MISQDSLIKNIYGENLSKQTNSHQENSLELLDCNDQVMSAVEGSSALNTSSFVTAWVHRCYTLTENSDCHSNKTKNQNDCQPNSIAKKTMRQCL